MQTFAFHPTLVATHSICYRITADNTLNKRLGKQGETWKTTTSQIYLVEWFFDGIGDALLAFSISSKVALVLIHSPHAFNKEMARERAARIYIFYVNNTYVFEYIASACVCMCVWIIFQPARLNHIVEWKVTNNEIQRTSTRGFVDIAYKYIIESRHSHTPMVRMKSQRFQCNLFSGSKQWCLEF